MLLERAWERQNRVTVLVASASLIAAIALLDWWTKPYLTLGLLYLFPIMLAAGAIPRWITVLLACACAVLSKVFSGLPASGSTIRLAFETVALVGCGLFIAELARKRGLTPQAQARLRTIIETSPAAIVTVDGEGTIELSNSAACDLMQPDGNNLTGQPIVKFLPELENALLYGEKANIRACMHCLGHKGNGETFDAEVWFCTHQDGKRAKLTAIVADVGEEQASDERCSLIPNNAVDRISLNAREIAVLRLIFEGLRNKEIEARLHMTPSAVKNTLAQLFRKAGVTSRSQLVRIALDRYQDLL